MTSPEIERGIAVLDALVAVVAEQFGCEAEIVAAMTPAELLATSAAVAALHQAMFAAARSNGAP